jgi:hypothetical protein
LINSFAIGEGNAGGNAAAAASVRMTKRETLGNKDLVLDGSKAVSIQKM